MKFYIINICPSVIVDTQLASWSRRNRKIILEHILSYTVCIFTQKRVPSNLVPLKATSLQLYQLQK